MMMINAISAANLLQAKPGALELVDVREAWEHQQFNIGGKNIPLSKLMECLDEIDFSKEVVVYCEKGIRSMIAIQRLSAKYPDAKFTNVVGGVSSIR